MASVIRNSSIENLFAPPEVRPDSRQSRSGVEQSFSDVLERAEPVQGEGRGSAQVQAVDRDTPEASGAADTSVGEDGAPQRDGEDAAPAKSTEQASDAGEAHAEAGGGEASDEAARDEGESASDVLNELALALSGGVSEQKPGVKEAQAESAQAGLGSKPVESPVASKIAGAAVEGGAVAVEQGVEKPSVVKTQPGAPLAAQAEANAPAVSAQTPSQSQDKSAGEQPANSAAGNALAGDAVKAGVGQNLSGAFELPRELQAVVDTAGTRDTGAKVSASQQVSAEQRAQSDQEALNTARLHRGLASAVKQNGGAVTLRLTPPEIGTVRIELQMSGTTLSAAFHTETASAMSLINRQLDQLRTSLETQGLNVDKVTVQTMPGAQNQADAGQQQDGERQNNNGRSGHPGSQRDRGGDPESDDRSREKPNSFNHHLDDASSDAE